MKDTRKSKKWIGITTALAALIVLGSQGAVIYAGAESAAHPKTPEPLSQEDSENLHAQLDSFYGERNSIALKNLPYAVKTDPISISAKSAILVDTLTGCILYEKNADELIPPASMTKLVEMYVVYEAAANGEISLDDEVPLPPESWEQNIPSDASRMHLGPGEHVTLRELLLGLAIASGNDASIAVAHYVAGTMEDFVARMNRVVENLGLVQTHFVESSGYSEKNLTTAREFATFARHYINRFPDSLKDFHAQPSITYPKAKNLSDDQKRTGNFQSFTQKNTNRLLETLPGCDGLKTGFIYESGYNISVTAERNGTRFLSVTMGGPGSNTQEGNYYRVKDNTALMEFAFSHFTDYHGTGIESVTIGLLGAKEKSARLIPAFSDKITIPITKGNTARSAVENVSVETELPPFIQGEIRQGMQYGKITFKMGETVLLEIPLVAERSVEKSGIYGTFTGILSGKILEAAK